MKAILRGGAGLLGLLLAGSVSFGYVLVTPVYKQPYPQAPNMCNTPGVYFIDAWGRLLGPYYYLTPPCQPFGGMLPGKTGQAIMSGCLPHTLLLSKEGLAIGQVPMVGQKGGTPVDQPHAAPGAGLPEMGGPQGAYLVAGAPSTLGPMNAPQPNLQIPYGQAPRMPIPYGQPPYPMPMPNPNTQVPYPLPPYGSMPFRGMPASMPYPMPMPYGSMPYGAAPMPYPAPMPPRMPMTYYPTSNANYARYYDPRTGISQAQNLTPMPQPFMPIPGFGVPPAPMGPMPPGMPPAPTPPGMPMAPTAPMGPMGTPGMDMGGQNGFQFFGPMQQSERLQPLYPLQQMQPPMPRFEPMQPMQLPRMDYAPPPAVKVGGAAYPTHPFVRSPRDFFMWGENMEDEERMRRRPFPVP